MRAEKLTAFVPLAVAMVVVASGPRSDPRGNLVIQWVPSSPKQGSLVRFAVRPDSIPIERIWARMAGQPLHFERGTDGAFHAIGAVPVDARDSVALTVTVHYEAVEPVRFTRYIPVTDGGFTVERLRVAPRFSQRPDSALRERIRREQAQAYAVARNSHRRPRLWRGPFVRPVDGRITSPFGRGREFNGELQSRHMGVDLHGTTGAPIHATARGIVALVGDFYYAGNVVYIDHGGGLVTAYLHMSEVAVAQGDTVGRGQLIGRVGATGRVTGPHLHWIARYGTVSFNALDLLETGEGW